MQLSSRMPSTILRFSLMLAALGCGSDSDGAGDGALCTTFGACGGDPTGTWESRDVCLADGFGTDLMTDLPVECDEAFVVDDLTSSTTLTFGADGTSTQAGAVTVDWAMAFDSPCIGAAVGQPADDAIIAAFCDGFQSRITTGPDALFPDATCSVMDATCTCDARQEVDVSGSGPYAVQGNRIDFEGGSPQEFCVQGDQLQVASIEPGLEGAHVVYTRVAP